MLARAVFVGALTVALSVVVVAARRAGEAHNRSVNHLAHEVPGLIAARAALGMVFYSGVIAWLAWPRALTWMYLPISMGVQMTAAALMGPALVWFAWSITSLGANYRGGVGLYDAHALVTTGPYRWVRHPIYLAFLAIMFLALLLSTNWVLGVSGLVLVTTIAVVRIPIEERELAERFGRAWGSYRRRTGCLIPRVRREDKE